MNSRTWKTCGEMTLCSEGRPKFPEVPTGAGLYRLRLKSGWLYIGEAGNLRKRLSEYRRLPKAKIVQEFRLHHALVNAQVAIVDVMTDDSLMDKRYRTKIESEEISAAREKGERLLNGRGPDDEYILKLDIRFHECELEKLNKKLQVLRQRSIR